MNVAALIPVKRLAHAKQRLGPLLSADERELLAEAMLREVLGAVAAAPDLRAAFVVTGDARAAAIAATFGAGIIHEERELGESAAVTFALGVLAQRGYDAVLVLPADIPLVRARDVELLIDARPKTSPFVLLVPSRDRKGTNALLLSPPGVIELGFGPDSFSYHLKQATACGLKPRIMENPRIELDLDEPKDIEILFKSTPHGSCHELLFRLIKEASQAVRP